MFHVEHFNFKHLVLSLFSVVFFASCEKTDPNPELKDPIYADLQAQLGATEKSLIETQKNMDEQRVSLEGAEPQTGKANVFKKRYFQAQSIADRLTQQIKYWKIRIEERKLFARRAYLEAIKEKKEWPDPKEYEIYLSEKKLRVAKLEWDSKQRIEEAKKDLPKPASANSEGEKKE